MNIIDNGYSQPLSVLAYSTQAVKKTELVPRPVAIYHFISPLDALPITCTYVQLQLVGIPEYKLAYFSNNVFFGIEEGCPYHLKNIICWKPAFNEGFHAIA